MIDEITEFIADKASLTKGTNIFVGHRPQSAADACDVVLETTGGEVFTDLPERADPVIQVLSRGGTYFTARDRAYAIYDAIYRNWASGSAGWTIGPIEAGGQEYEVMAIVPLAPPQNIGQDKKLRFEFSTNYIFKIKKL